MKKIIFYISLTLNALFVASALTYAFFELRPKTQAERDAYAKYEARLNAHYKLIEQSTGPLTLGQKYIVRDIVSGSERLPKGLCDAVYSPQGGRDVSSESK